ncbi:YolD-like family protein [Lentibacillus salicampi]|nr:YolD-like family protein [Lentibacillus salicampi]
MPNDRGSIKWTSLMMPEHIELLKEMWVEDDKNSKPVLDEQQVEFLNVQLQEAFEDQDTVCLRIYENDAMIELTGVVAKLDNQTSSVLLNRFNRPDKRIAFQNILQLVF